MIEFEKPNIECLEVDNENNYARFECQPLERGYGMTIGNSLRRILLSSLPGTAITSVKIDGVVHEFATIPDVVEDVPELIVNLKSVRLKTFDNDEKILRVDFKGPGEVTAKDIITDGTIEVLNGDLHIATVEEGGHLKMEMTAGRGRGYNTADKNKKENQVRKNKRNIHSKVKRLQRQKRALLQRHKKNYRFRKKYRRQNHRHGRQLLRRIRGKNRTS